MNIFYLHKDPEKAARYQYNKHVVKMILESAQMLCTAHHCIMGDDADVPYKPAHRNHPSTKWVAENLYNTAWLIQHGCALSSEYHHRYGKIHTCAQTLFEAKKLFHRKTELAIICHTQAKDFSRAMPDEW